MVVTSFEENEREVDEARLSQLKRVATAMKPGVEMSEFLKRAIRCAVRPRLVLGPGEEGGGYSFFVGCLLVAGRRVTRLVVSLLVA